MDYPEQIDVAWLAVDETGAVAVMITAGEGPIPRPVLANDPVDVLAVEEALLRLPPIATPSVHVQVPDPSSFEALSERGLFVYDWTDVHRSRAAERGLYELVASPSVSLRLSELPMALRGLAASLDGQMIGEPELKVR